MSAEDLYRQAQQHAAADRHGEAVEAYSNALALDDGHWKARFGRAVALHRLGDLAAARQDFDRVMSDGPECAEAFYSRAAMRYDSGVFRATLEDCDTALRLKPGYTDALYLRAVARKALEDFDGALHDFNAVLAANAGYREAYYGRGTVWHTLERWADAIRDFSGYLRHYPTHCGALLLRGLSYYRLEQRVAYNKQLFLSHTLCALVDTAQPLDEPFEVVVDDASTDSTAAEAGPAAELTP
jgi:tetratricopeptide (TPR) repeat protein